MDKRLLQKYFRNQCTLEEIEQVMDWFQTKEGKAYFEERLDRDMKRYAGEENMLLHPDIPSDEMYLKITQAKSKGTTRKKDRDYWWLRAAAILLICGVFAGGGYWLLQDSGYMEMQKPDITYRTISTLEDQQRLVTLGDGSQIRLNANSSIEVPEQFPADRREVILNGEAYFEVARDNARPFSIRAGRAMIRVLGTEFNVRVDEPSRHVQVAVAGGRVSLSDYSDDNGSGAILTENTFALFHLDDGEILIEQSPVDNYLSWISGNLYFYDEPLWIVSRYLERLYGVSFRFEGEHLKGMHLSTDIMKRDLVSVLDIISQTLAITYTLENDTVSWMEENNI